MSSGRMMTAEEIDKLLAIERLCDKDFEVLYSCQTIEQYNVATKFHDLVMTKLLRMYVHVNNFDAHAKGWAELARSLNLKGAL